MQEKKTKITYYISLAFLFFLLLFLFVGQFFLKHDPYATNLSDAFIPKGENGYPLGTDQLGRCILCRIIAGGRQTVFSSMGVVAVVLVFGSVMGMLAGYSGGAIDSVITKITTVFQAFPGFVLAVAIAGILGPGKGNGMLALILVYWTTYARYSRSLVLNLKNNTFVRAAKMCGAGRFSILIKYILPNMIPPLLVTAALDIGNVVLNMAGLSYLGLGGARPTAEWGAMMSESRRFMQTNTSLIVIPGIALFIVVFLFNICSDCARNYYDKRGSFHE
jgi:peptide/nickel transport system permease protein/nickel transport system permease protein